MRVRNLRRSRLALEASVYIKPKFYKFRRQRRESLAILDIGLDNNSYEEAKWVFPHATYTGVDIKSPSQAVNEPDRFLRLDLEKDFSLDVLGGECFDLIVINHVLEHLANGERVFAALAGRVKPGGFMYAEFPGLRTAAHPKSPWRYHFHDDPTHKRFYVLEDLANLALQHGLRVSSCGPVSTPWKDLLTPFRALTSAIKRKNVGPELIFLQRKVIHICVTRPADG